MKKENEYFQKMTAEETFENLKTTKKGLSSEEAQKRIIEYGENSLEEKKESLLKKLFSFFWGPIPFMIEIAAILSAALEKWPDLIIILIMLFINAALGFFQEFKAGNAINALKKTLALHARVLRDGIWKDIESKFLVPGDVILVKLGNIIPADIKLISGEYLSVDQSALTGESLPVDKKSGDIAYSGTIAKKGEMEGIVTHTGMKTFFGKTAKLVSGAITKSHFQEAVIKIGNFLIISTLSVCAIILAVSIYRIEVFHSIHETIGQIIIFILVLVIAGIPIALPAVLSVTMAIGANRLAKLKAIVAKLTSVEELASMDILCCDKTGTLTKNELMVGEIVPFEKATTEEILQIAALASQCKTKDAIDEAIINKLTDTKFIENYKIKKFIPFDPVSKKTEVEVITNDGTSMLISKGAPQVIAKLLNNEEKEKIIMEDVEKLADKGYRTLGVAEKRNDKWRFLGLIPLFDPPRNDTKETLKQIKDMGVKIKMVTGDHAAIAKELASNLNLGTNIISVGQLYKRSDTLSRNRDRLIEKANGFSEVFPEHKFEIVETLQKQKHIVGMTGDGVNDAPALKQADIGIAVSGATDAAKEAADLVLTESGLLVISHAIAEARRIFGRMKSYAMYRISETMRLLLFLFASMIVFNDHPLSALMIILIALLNDIPIMMIAYDNMRAHSNPVFWNMKEVLIIAIGIAIAGVISTFGLYWIGDKYWFSYVKDPIYKFNLLRTLAFMGILCGGNITIFLTRNIGAFWEKPFPEIKFLLSSLFSLSIGTLASVYGLGTSDFVGIGWEYVGLSWAYILIWFFISMFIKEALYRIIGYRKEYYEKFVEKTGEKITPF